MNNIDIVNNALTEWAFKVAKSFLPQVQLPRSVATFMGLLGADPAKYNIWNELGFLAEPMIQTIITPAVYKMLGGIPDAQIPDLARKFIDSFVTQAQTKGSVDLFGLTLGPDAFEGLRDIYEQHLNNSSNDAQ